MTEESFNSFSKFNVTGVTGYIPGNPQGLLALGHTASASPWQDTAIHLHTDSEEYYFLLKGHLEFLVADYRLALQPNEILMVQPGVPHAILGGAGPIEHFGMRAPAVPDKQVVGELRKDCPYRNESERLLSGEWGYRIPLDMPQHKNCWLIGAGSALYKSQHLIVAYMDFETNEMANASVGTRDQPHLHQRSWEYYLVLRGEEVQQIEDINVSIHPGEILAVSPNVKHNLRSRTAPYLGFTIRVPVELNDKVLVKP